MVVLKMCLDEWNGDSCLGIGLRVLWKEYRVGKRVLKFFDLRIEYIITLVWKSRSSRVEYQI